LTFNIKFLANALRNETVKELGQINDQLFKRCEFKCGLIFGRARKTASAD